MRAGLAERSWEWPWSSAAAHISGEADGLTKITTPFGGIEDWAAFLDGPGSDLEVIRKHSRTGRPLGDSSFLDRCARLTGLDLALGKPGRPKRSSDEAKQGH